MSIIVKHRTDIDLVAERVAVKLAAQSGAEQAPGRPRASGRDRRAACSPSSRSCAARASRSGPRRSLDAFAALEEVSWTDQRDFREALAATVAKSQEDRRIFELLFDRHFFRAAEAEALEREVARSERFEGGDRLDLDELREAIRQAIGDGNDGEMRDLAAARDRRLRRAAASAPA